MLLQKTSTWDKCQQAAITRTTMAIAIVVVTVAVMATATSAPKNNKTTRNSCNGTTNRAKNMNQFPVQYSCGCVW